MSGICGILRLDGGPPEGIEAMAERLQRRGPEGTHFFRDGPCALGHTLLATTPEAQHEIMPLTHSESGCTITADVRLDNREVLIPALGLNGETRIIGDGELILLSYLRWGQDCVDHLLGDFAFVIWDPREQQFFAARDQMGMKQLIYSHQPGLVFAFASDPPAVLKASGVPKRINEGRIADFLEEYLEVIDYTCTFFEGVSRLPPAHCLTMNAQGVTLRRYWQLKPGPELELESDAAYAEAFREVFTKAVRCRLRSNGPVGSMLSGGMDSGSVVAVASRLLAQAGTGPLHTFSAVGPDPASCVETRTVLASLTMPGLMPHLINYAELENYTSDLILALERQSDPFDYSMSLVRAMYLSAQRAGLRVVLDGGAGDIVLTAGSPIARLIQSGRLWQAWREASGLARFYSAGNRLALRVLGSGLREALAPDWMRHLRERWRQRRNQWPLGALIGPDFARSVDLSRRATLARNHFPVGLPDPATQRANTIAAPALTVGRERYDRVATYFSIEPRDPFMDLRVVQFCLGLPQHQVQRDGWRKMILRRATKGLLPDAVRWRIGKEHLGPKFTEAVLASRSDWQHAATAALVHHVRYFRPQPLVGSRQAAEKELYYHEYARLFALNVWLDMAEVY